MWRFFYFHLQSQVKSCHVASHHIISGHDLPFYVISCHAMSHHVMPCHIMSCDVMSHNVRSCHIMSCHITCHVMLHTLQLPCWSLVTPILFTVHFQHSEIVVTLQVYSVFLIRFRYRSDILS